jgi:hypothetical protein
MADQTMKDQVVKEALEKYGLDEYSTVELVRLIKEEWSIEVTVADVNSMKSRLRRGLEKPRSKYPTPPERP